MINQFKVGCNFDWQLIDKVAELNEKYKDKAVVKEFFGSPSSAAPMTARPDWRLPDMSDKDFEKYVKLSLDKGIYKPGDEINYRVLLTTKSQDVPVEKETEISIYDGNENVLDKAMHVYRYSIDEDDAVKALSNIFSNEETILLFYKIH